MLLLVLVLVVCRFSSPRMFSVAAVVLLEGCEIICHLKILQCCFIEIHQCIMINTLTTSNPLIYFDTRGGVKGRKRRWARRRWHVDRSRDRVGAGHYCRAGADEDQVVDCQQNIRHGLEVFWSNQVLSNLFCLKSP